MLSFFLEHFQHPVGHDKAADDIQGAEDYGDKTEQERLFQQFLEWKRQQPVAR